MRNAERGVRNAGPPQVVIALGSNLGDSRATILKAMDSLQGLAARPIVRSSLWRSQPVNCPPGSGDFVNAAVAMVARQGESPESLLPRLREMEMAFGRQPKRIVNEARPLDLDIIAFGGETRDTESLRIPHPRAHLRRFVLAPVAEVAPDLILPGQDQTVAALLERLADDEMIERLGWSG